jgi:hypothetical protein
MPLDRTVVSRRVVDDGLGSVSTRHRVRPHWREPPVSGARRGSLHKILRRRGFAAMLHKVAGCWVQLTWRARGERHFRVPRQRRSRISMLLASIEMWPPPCTSMFSFS